MRIAKYLWLAPLFTLAAILPAQQVAIGGYNLPEANSGPDGIARATGGVLWFTENTSNKIGRITTAGAVTEYPLPTASAGPLVIAPGIGGDMWFTEFSARKLGRITSAGDITEYGLLRANGNPYGITWGPDGAVWFTLNTNVIGRTSPGSPVGSSTPD